MILLVDEEYGSDCGEGEAGEHGDAPPGLQLEQHGGVVQGEVEAAGKQGREDGGHQAQDHHRGEVGGVQEHVPGATGHSHQGHCEEGVLEHIRIARC